MKAVLILAICLVVLAIVFTIYSVRNADTIYYDSDEPKEFEKFTDIEKEKDQNNLNPKQ